MKKPIYTEKRKVQVYNFSINMRLIENPMSNLCKFDSSVYVKEQELGSFVV